MSHKSPDLRIVFFMLALGLITGVNSIHAQTATNIVAPTDAPLVVNAGDSILAQRAIAVLEQLGREVMPYESQQEFESGRRLAHVPLETFTGKLNQATVQLESILSQMSATKLKTHLRNALCSYRDGAYWWARMEPQKVVSVASLQLAFTTTTPAERFLTSALPHTVVIHWRHASKYLKRARVLIADSQVR